MFQSILAVSPQSGVWTIRLKRTSMICRSKYQNLEVGISGQQSRNIFCFSFLATEIVKLEKSWDFVEKEKPNFDLVTLTPPMVYGPLRHTIQSTNDLNQPNLRICSGLVNSSKDAKLPPNGLHAFTDVRDLAEANVLAETLPEASGQRFIVCEGQISSQNISDILRKNIPELEERTPKGISSDKGL
ncbi:hypothetical protein BPAE_0249g00010 [Botrytis paeoniae]|uniref:NAD-dependent epimerase/dehydratase domain-containing protein n=1 Tax=Botrytis paeoniae TaxID=278948 RepID=A0A4Z1F8U4_9HELO|nr:hypothetical protein BPAE_0249g00010 [Botrytis paeoniae]